MQKSLSTSKKQLRIFGILIGIFFPLFIGFIVPLIWNHPFRIWTLFVSAIGFCCGLLIPKILYYPYLIWIKIGYLLGWINSKIILGLVFIIILIPIGFIMKLFGYDPLKIRQIKKMTVRNLRFFNADSSIRTSLSIPKKARFKN